MSSTPEQDARFFRFYPDARPVCAAIRDLTKAGRTGNNSQIASRTGLSRTKVADLTTMLRQRGFIKDVSRGAAYHWRLTGKQLPEQETGK